MSYPDAAPGPSRLELLADAAGLDPWTVRAYLEDEVDRRRRAQYQMHANAYAALDRRIGLAGDQQGGA